MDINKLIMDSIESTGVLNEGLLTPDRNKPYPDEEDMKKMPGMPTDNATPDLQVDESKSKMAQKLEDLGLTGKKAAAIGAAIAAGLGGIALAKKLRTTKKAAAKA